MHAEKKVFADGKKRETDFGEKENAKRGWGARS
jgi:hypothetical protein